MWFRLGGPPHSVIVYIRGHIGLGVWGLGFRGPIKGYM